MLSRRRLLFSAAAAAYAVLTGCNRGGGGSGATTVLKASRQKHSDTQTIFYNSTTLSGVVGMFVYYMNGGSVILYSVNGVYPENQGSGADTFRVSSGDKIRWYDVSGQVVATINV